MESITVGGLTLRWSDGVLVITTPTGQHILNGRATADILVFLDANRDEIFATDQAGAVPEWAQPQQGPGRSVIGSIVEQERRLPAASTDRRRRSRRGRGKV